MGSVASFLKMFRGGAETAAAPMVDTRQKMSRRSTGLLEFTKAIQGQEGLCMLDLGSTSPINISRLTGLGHKLYNEDLLTSSSDPALQIRSDDGKPAFNVEQFLAENLAFDHPMFDGVLFWDIADYLPEAAVKPVVDRMAAVMKPGGVLLAFFHTRDAGPETPYHRYHIAGNDSLDFQPGSRFRLQRVFNNRHIENLFKEFSSLKFFLARDNMREVLVIR